MIVLYGLDPIEAECQSAEFTVWAWYAIWTYLEEIHPDFACVVPVSEDGHVLGSDECDILAMRLDRDLHNGTVDRYTEERSLILSAMPDVECHICAGTGVRSDVVGEDLGMIERPLHPEVAVRVMRSSGWCNLCRGHGKLFDFEKSHELTRADIDEFAGFLECSGGMYLSTPF